MTRFSVLVFHRAVGFVHQSIPDTVEAIVELGAAHDFAVTATDDPDQLVALDAIDVVAFAHTTGDAVPGAEQRGGLESFVRDGGGFVGIHAASSNDDTVRSEWPWFVELVGADFAGHVGACIFGGEPFEPSVSARHGGSLADAPPDAEPIGDELAVVSWETGHLLVERPDDPPARGLRTGPVAEEWYGFTDNPRERVHVVASVDESSYDPGSGEMGADHPVIWWRDFDGGRSIYTSMGHAKARWHEPWFRAHVLGCLELAARVAP